MSPETRQNTPEISLLFFIESQLLLDFVYTVKYYSSRRRKLYVNDNKIRPRLRGGVHRNFTKARRARKHYQVYQKELRNNACIFPDRKSPEGEQNSMKTFRIWYKNKCAILIDAPDKETAEQMAAVLYPDSQVKSKDTEELN